MESDEKSRMIKKLKNGYPSGRPDTEQRQTDSDRDETGRRIYEKLVASARGN